MLSAHRLLSAVLATAMLATAPACASQGGYGRYPRTARVDDRAYRTGYQDGRVLGENDARRGRSFDYGRHPEYRQANRRDNDRGYGRDDYQRAFRQGFVAGYDDGYRRYARNTNQYPSSGPNVYGSRDRGVAIYRSPAADNGYREGYEAGRKDGRDGNRFDPVREGRYRDGDHGYNSRYGSRDEYKREYRAAFQQGYDRGYREARR